MRESTNQSQVELDAVRYLFWRDYGIELVIDGCIREVTGAELDEVTDRYRKIASNSRPST